MDFSPEVTWDPEVESYLRGALGDARFEATAAALSRPPRTTCMRVNTLRTSPQEVVARVLEQLGQDCAPGVVQVHPQVPCAVVLQGSGPHGVSYAAAGGREVIISRKAGEAVLRGAPVFAPGVLAVSSGVGRGEVVALAVGKEKPGGDTPEITRGTTLYTNTTCTAATAQPTAAAATTVIAAEGGTAAMTGLREQAAEAQAGEGTNGEGPKPQGPTIAPAAPGDGARSVGRPRQRQRRHGPADGTGAGAVPETSPSSSGGVPPPLAPGWTGSSQGPVAPRSGMYVGLARTAMSRQEMFRAREGLALELVEPVFRVPPAVGGLPPGWVMLQNLPSLVAALALSPAPGSRVLDMCAAPGGKTTLLAALMGDQGEIVAFDRTHSKVSEIVSLARELGVTCIRARKMDAGKALLRPTGQNQQQLEGQQAQPEGQQPASSGTGNGTSNGSLVGDDGTVGAITGVGEDGGAGAAEARERRAERNGAAEAAGTMATAGCAGGQRPAGGQVMSEKARLREERRRAVMIKRGIKPPEPREADADAGLPPAYPPESFDAVLLDAPCSALGLRPRLQQQAGALYLRQCAAAQRRLVDTAVQLLRTGGALVYSTCTINPGENEACVRYLLDKYGCSFRLVPAGPPFLGGPGLVGRHPCMAEAGRPITDTDEAPAAAAASSAVADGAPGVAEAVAAAAVAKKEEEEGKAGRCCGGGGGVKGSGLGVSSGGGEVWLSEAEAAMVQRFDPSDPQLDTIGFFVAKFEKTAPVEG